MKKGDKVWISWQDISGIGYGDSINTSGEIVSDEDDMGKLEVEYKNENYPFNSETRYFYENDLKLLDS